jgi:hypothetical protein
MPSKSNSAVATMGIDIGKNSFHASMPIRHGGVWQAALGADHATTSGVPSALMRAGAILLRALARII